MSPFLLGKAVKLQAGSVANIRKLRNGTVLIKTKDTKQAAALQQLEKIQEIPVKVDAERTLNYSKGVVKCKDLTLCSNEEIVKDLKFQGLVACTNISVRSETGDRRNTNTFILTFHTTSPPKHIYVTHFLRVPVAVYVPNPFRCFNCQKFGHAQNNCKGQKVCAHCATPGHDTKDCSSQLKYANCDGDHAAFSKECPWWQREKKCSKSRPRLGCLLWRLGRLFDHTLHPEMDSPLQQQHRQEYSL